MLPYAFVNCISARMSFDTHYIQTALAHLVAAAVVVVVVVVLIALSVAAIVPVSVSVPVPVPAVAVAPTHSHSLPRSFEYVPISIDFSDALLQNTSHKSTHSHSHSTGHRQQEYK